MSSRIRMYGVETIASFSRGYALALERGLVNTRSTSFNDSFHRSLHELYQLIDTDNAKSWNRKEANHYHSWLRYDSMRSCIVGGRERGCVVLSTGRNDEWSNELVDNAIAEYSEDSIAEWAEFIDTDEYKERLDFISDYYQRTGNFFSFLIEKHKKGEPLTRSEYARITENKYAVNVLLAHKSDPIFEVGSLVSLRTRHNETSDIDGKLTIHKSAPLGLLILSNTVPVVSACKGAKRYKVVPVGDSRPFYIEERFLKKRRKKVNKKK